MHAPWAVPGLGRPLRDLQALQGLCRRHVPVPGPISAFFQAPAVAC